MFDSPGKLKRHQKRHDEGKSWSRAVLITEACICCGSILSLVQIFFSFVSNSLSCYYHTLPYPKTKEKKIWNKDKIEPQHI